MDDSILAHSTNKNYLADRIPFSAHFHPISLAKIGTRSIAIQGAQILLQYTEQLSEIEDEDADLPAPDLPPMDVFFTKVGIQMTKSISITTVIRLLEEGALRMLDVRVAGKLMKNVRSSAVRKYSRTSSRWVAGQLIVTTGMKASLLGHIAVFLTEEVFHILYLLQRYFQSRRVQCEAQQIEIEDEDNFAQFTIKNFGRLTGSIVCSGIGAAVGTCVCPGIGTFVGTTLGDSVMYMA